LILQESSVYPSTGLSVFFLVEFGSRRGHRLVLLLWMDGWMEFAKISGFVFVPKNMEKEGDDFKKGG